MLYSRILLVLIITISIVKNSHGTTIENSINIVTNFLQISNDGEIDDKMCKYNKCILKCCPKNKYIRKFQNCRNIDANYTNLDITNVPLYDRYFQKIGKNLKDTDVTILSGVFSIDTFTSNVDDGEVLYGYKHYLTEEGVLYEVRPSKTVALKNGQFCMDYRRPRAGETEPRLRFWTQRDMKHKEATDVPDISFGREKFITAGFVVSSVFLSLVLLVYYLLPELRSLGGLLLMAYVASLLGAYVLHASLLLKSSRSASYCYVSTLLAYFFWLASFCWTFAVSWDIWWTFRGFAKSQAITRHSDLFKFAMYCACAWGGPLAATALLVALDTHIDKSHTWLAPGLRNPYCFITGPPKVIYLYSPMLFLSLCNWVFFILTVRNMRCLQRKTNMLNKVAVGYLAAQRKQRQRLMVYLRLSVIMGVNWVLEVLSYYRPEDYLSYISDAFNVLLGLAIFIVFVCKRKIFAKLVKRYRGCARTQRIHYRSRFSDNSESEGPHSPLRVCTDPVGNAPASPDKRQTAIFKF